MKGFTLIEILVVIALFSGLLALGLLMGFETFRGTLHRSEVATIVSLSEKARSRAMNNIDQSTWGICYLAPEYLILKGTSVCSSAAATDRVLANAAVAATSDFDHLFPVVVFTQLSGTTTPASLTVKQDGRMAVVSINYEGTVLW